MNRKTTYTFLLVALLMTLLLAVGSTAAAKSGDDVDFYLTILHNNDGESQVINAGSGLEDFGGAARTWSWPSMR